MRLYEFKALMQTRILELRNVLVKKYPEKAERINEIVDMLMSKLHVLRAITLSDFIFTLYLVSKEFEEFKELIPDTKTIERLLRSQE